MNDHERATRRAKRLLLAAEQRLMTRWQGTEGERKRAVLMHFLANGTCTRRALCQAFPDVHPDAMGRSLAELEAEGYLDHPGRNQPYTPTDHALTVLEQR